MTASPRISAPIPGGRAPKHSFDLDLTMRPVFHTLIWIVAAAPLHAGEPKKIDFVHDIAPIIKARCAACHTNGKYKAGVSFDTREELLKKLQAGKPLRSPRGACA